MYQRENILNKQCSLAWLWQSWLMPLIVIQEFASSNLVGHPKEHLWKYGRAVMQHPAKV